MDKKMIVLTLRADEIGEAVDLSKILNDTYKKAGLTVNCRKNPATKDYCLYVHLDMDKAHKRIDRGGGRKLANKYKKVTCADVEKMMIDKTQKQVMDELGMTRATFYRRLKQMREHGDMSKEF